MTIARLILRGLLFALPFCVLSSHANALTLHGHVTDESGAGLPGVAVGIPALQRGGVTDDAGSYRIDNLSHGVYAVEFSLIGHLRETRSIELTPENDSLSVILRVTALEVGGITVTGTPEPHSLLESPQPTTLVEGSQLDRAREQTVIGTIENTPGVTTYSTGAGIAKPVIRGLTSQRVLVVSDGVRQEGQQWGDEHAPEIDALDVEKIEVVRGPSSVIYGSDAMGGVVNVISGQLPSADTGAPRLSGKAVLNAFSNNSQGAGGLTLAGASKQFGYRGSLSGRNAQDTDTPDGKLSNSGENELNGSGAIGIQGERGSASVDYAHFGSRMEIHEDPAEEPDFTGYQKIRHDHVHLHALVPFSEVRFEAEAGWQRNNRREFEEKDASAPGLDLLLQTTTLEVKAHHHPGTKFTGTVGGSIMHQTNESRAEEKLIPDFAMTDVAGYLYEEARLQKVTFSAGIRGESRTLDVDPSEDLAISKQSKDFSAVTGTFGIVWRAMPDFAIAANAGRGWRAPTAFELFADGVHEGTVRFEIGDSTLDPEVSFNLDLGIRYASPRAQGEITIFRNAIDKFIYNSPTGETDSESGFGVYQTKQANAVLKGVEASAQIQATEWLILRGGADMVRGDNDETNKPLPLMPPDRVRLGLRLAPKTHGQVSNPYASVDLKLVAKQDRIEEYETTTAGYALTDIGAGFDLPVGGNRVSIDFGVQNLFDRAYREALSRYKDYALNPGRNFTLKATVPLVFSK